MDINALYYNAVIFMCELCKSQDTVRINKNILDTLIIAADLTIDDFKTLGLIPLEKKATLDFKPNENLGEGKATPEELKYRQEILDLGDEFLKGTDKVINSKSSPTQQLEEIDKLANTYITDGQKLIKSKLPDEWDNTTDEGIKILKKLDSKKKYNPKKIETIKKDLILQHSLFNIEDIGLKARGRLRQYILLNAIQSPNDTSLEKSIITKATSTSNWTPCMIQLHRTQPELSEQELRDECNQQWQNAFTDLQDNSDKLGLFGWLTTHKEALLASLIMGVSILGEIVADFATCEDLGTCDPKENPGPGEDGPVCDDCLSLSGETFSILDAIWSIIIHFGCRCGMMNIRLQTSNSY